MLITAFIDTTVIHELILQQNWVCQELCVKKFSRLHHSAS